MYSAGNTSVRGATRAGTPIAGQDGSRIGAGLVILLALFIDVAGTRWGSYISVPGTPLYLADLLLLVGASLAGLARRRDLDPAMLAASGLLGSYIVLRFLLADANRILILRDLAPFGYLALVPFVALALRDVPAGTFLRIIRVATLFLATISALRLAGLVRPWAVLPAVFEQPVFSARPDVDAIVLGLGILAFGTWRGVAPGHRLVQVSMLVLAALSYSRAGFVAALFCAVVAAWRERSTLTARPGVIASSFSIAFAGILMLVLSFRAQAGIGLNYLEAVSRLLQSDVDAGTTGARLSAWRLVFERISATGTWLAGEGPGSEPIADSGAVRYLSGALDVRAAHNWVVTALAYHGVLGLLLWSGALAVALRGATRTHMGALVIGGVGAYLIGALLGVVVESPFGSLPICVMAAWSLSRHAGMVVIPQRAARRGGGAAG